MNSFCVYLKKLDCCYVGIRIIYVGVSYTIYMCNFYVLIHVKEENIKRKMNWRIRKRNKKDDATITQQ